MRTMNLAHTKAHLSELINTVESGVEVVITRHGHPVARVVPISRSKQALPLQQLAALRQQVPARQGSSADALRELRDAE